MTQSKSHRILVRGGVSALALVALALSYDLARAQQDTTGTTTSQDQTGQPQSDQARQAGSANGTTSGTTTMFPMGTVVPGETRSRTSAQASDPAAGQDTTAMSGAAAQAQPAPAQSTSAQPAQGPSAPVTAQSIAAATPGSTALQNSGLYLPGRPGGQGISGPVTITPLRRPARQPRLTFSLSQRFETDDNADLDPDSAGRSNEALTNLGLNWFAQTPATTLQMGLSGQLRGYDGPDETEQGFVDPTVSFGWQHTSAASALSLNARYRESDISTLRNDPAELIADPTLAETSGGGTRKQTNIDALASFRINTPLSYNLGYQLADTDYSGGDGGKTPNRRQTVFAGLNAIFDPVTTGQMQIGHELYERDPQDDASSTEADTEHTNFLSFGVTRLTATGGSVGADLTLSDRPEGLRTTLDLTRQFALPSGGFGVRVGASSGEDAIDFVGGLSWDVSRKTSRFALALDRSVSSDEDNGTELQTVLSANYSFDITASDRVGLNASHAATQGVGSDSGDSATTMLGVSYSRQLTQDWRLTSGYQHRLRQEDGEGDADSNTVFLTIGRQFVLQP